VNQLLIPIVADVGVDFDIHVANIGDAAGFCKVFGGKSQDFFPQSAETRVNTEKIFLPELLQICNLYVSLPYQNQNQMPIPYNQSVPNSIKIERIRTTEKGEKLIAFSRVHNFPKCKPQVSPCVFASYHQGILKIYNRADFAVFSFGSFAESLNFIRKSFSDF